MSKIKAVALFSGGLDSVLAVKIMLDMGIDVYPISFITPFSTFSKSGRKIAVQKWSDKFSIPLKVHFLGKEYIKLVKKPRYGYGKNINPCIDCRIFMLQKARKYMEDLGAEFIITGEVLGERPMTQNRRAMMFIERESGLAGRILRPLSAKLLGPTIPEQRGWVKRQELLEIEGRSRKPQMKLAEEFSILDYPTPAGGCLLTDSNFAKKLRDAFEHKEDSLKEITLLKYGRHFRLLSGAKVVVGRNEKENSIILAFQIPNSVYLEAEGVPGPITMRLGTKSKSDINIAASICLRYSDYGNEEGGVFYWQKSNKKSITIVKKIEQETLEKMRV